MHLGWNCKYEVSFYSNSNNSNIILANLSFDDDHVLMVMVVMVAGAVAV
jgi:hypothetical protein